MNMDNSQKMIITEEAADFSSENLKRFQDCNISAVFCTTEKSFAAESEANHPMSLLWTRS